MIMNSKSGLGLCFVIGILCFSASCATSHKDQYLQKYNQTILPVTVIRDVTLEEALRLFSNISARALSDKYGKVMYFDGVAFTLGAVSEKTLQKVATIELSHLTIMEASKKIAATFGIATEYSGGRFIFAENLVKVETGLRDIETNEQ